MQLNEAKTIYYVGNDSIGHSFIERHFSQPFTEIYLSWFNLTHKEKLKPNPFKLVSMVQYLQSFIRVVFSLALEFVDRRYLKISTTTAPYINPLSPSIKLQFLLLCFHAFLTEVVGRSF